MESVYRGVKHMMRFKKIAASLMALLMLAGPAGGTVSVMASDGNPYKDVSSSSWYYDAVMSAYENRYMEGVGGGRFDPEGILTRAMFVRMLANYEGAEPEETDVFPDVQKNSWYSGYVGWANGAGIVLGDDRGNFNPDSSITREELSVMVSRYVGYKKINLPRQSTAPAEFADSEKIAGWAADGVETMRRSGVLNGFPDQTFMPKSFLTRASAAQFIVNLSEAIDMAWQGYSPDTEADGYGIFGANYIYWNGTVFTDYRNRPEYDHSVNAPTFYKYQGLDLVTDGLDYPALSVPSDTKIGISCDVAQIDIRETPVVKVCYAYAKGNPDSALTGLMNINVDAAPQWGGRQYITEAVTLTPGADDANWATATYNLTDFVDKYADTLIFDQLPDRVDDLPYFLLTPEDDGNQFMVRYFAFFKTQEEADAFTSAQCEDYLKNYYVYTDVEYAELDDATRDEYDKLLSDRINEILNSESEITPETITGTAYYISNDGDDSAKGTSPETAWKSIKNLWKYYAGDTVRIPKLKAGDGVFFRRGDEWYAEQYNNLSLIHI